MSIRWLKSLLSLFIVYHLYGIILAPNSQTYLGFRSAPFLESYLSAFEFMSSWGFFAPEPGPPPIFVEWELLDKNGDTIEFDRFPTFPDPYIIRERFNRRMAIVRFMAGGDVRIEKMMVPYLCHKNRDVVSVRLWKTVYGIPSPLEISSGSRKVGDEKAKERHWVGHSFCRELENQG